jgi:UDP-N-acetylmuramate--alanine ligase
MEHIIKKAHLIGICGAGMSGIAEILHNMGIEVTGSDTGKGAHIEQFKALGIKVFSEHHSENLKHIANPEFSNKSVVIFSSAIHKNNPEIIAAQLLKIPVIHRSEMLAELMRTKLGIAVAGTHGKTTTTSILSACLSESKTDPTVVIGGKINQLNSNAQFGKSKYFLAELDESDGSFLRFYPHIAVITNIDKDHMDFYQSLDDIIKNFEKFISQIPFYGTLCACFDDPITQSILTQFKRKVVTYGLRPDSNISATNIELNGLNSYFNPVIFGKEHRKVNLKLPGKYNICNALASLAVCHALNLNIDSFLNGIEAFSGVEHRFTVVGKIGNITVVDDYAHNPQKIQTVLNGAKESFPNHNILCIFQPHRYTRLKSLMTEFSQCFKDADGVLVAPIYSASELPIPGITVQEVSKQIALNSFFGNQSDVKYSEDKEEVSNKFIEIFSKKLLSPCVILTLGAGDSFKFGEQILSKIKENYKE